MSLEQLATEREPIATTRRADADISEPPELHRSSYQSQCNELTDLIDRATADLRHGWIEAALDCLGRARRVLEVAS